MSSSTDGMSGDDLKAVCTEAGMFAIRAERRNVAPEDFIKSIGKMKNIN